MKEAISAVGIGLGLSLLWGLSEWIKWQHMKNGTILARGAIPGTYGNIISSIVKIICIVILVTFLSTLKVWLIVSVGLMWFIGGWIATLIERKLYCDNYMIKLIIFAAEEYKKDFKSTEKAADLMSVVVPKWWIKLMPQKWQSELRDKLANILLTEEQTDHKPR